MVLLQLITLLKLFLTIIFDNLLLFVIVPVVMDNIWINYNPIKYKSQCLGADH